MTRCVKLVACIVVGLALVAPAAAADRSQPPKPGPAPTLNLPPLERFTLSNGLPVFLVPVHEVPVVEVVLVVRSGATSDPEERLGLAKAPVAGMPSASRTPSTSWAPSSERPRPGTAPAFGSTCRAPVLAMPCL